MIVIAENRTNERSGGFLDENDVKIRMSLKDFFDDKIVFSDVLQKYFEIF